MSPSPHEADFFDFNGDRGKRLKEFKGMARARNIKPGFFENVELAELPIHARLLFIGLWTLADREGRLEDRPKQIRFKLMPYDEFDPEQSLQQLHNSGFILRYQADGNSFIQVRNFLKHQTPHCKEKESTIPAPDLHGVCTVQAPPDSLIPDSLIPDLKEIKTCPEPCSEPEHSFILKDGSTFKIPPEKVEEWYDLYEGVEVEKELQKIAEWSENNKAKRKTRDGAMRFVCSWLNRAEQNLKEKIGDRDNLFEMEVERVINGHS